MNTKLALVAASVVSFLVACSAAPSPTDDGTIVSPSTSAKTPSGADANGGAAPATGKDTGTGTSTGDAGDKGTTTGDKGGTGSADVAACVASCTTTLQPKCQGDATFCQDICETIGDAEIACLVAAPTCDKSEWVRCASENAPTKDADAGAGTGTGGKGSK